MRDPKRIKKVLAVVQKIWERNPDLRLGQLLGNITVDMNMLYYLEDDQLVEALNAVYNKTKDQSADDGEKEIQE